MRSVAHQNRITGTLLLSGYEPSTCSTGVKLVILLGKATHGYVVLFG
jgi:hypothetical protein